MIARAKNGTGKTAAFVIPSLERVDASKNHIQVSVRGEGLDGEKRERDRERERERKN